MPVYIDPGTGSMLFTIFIGIVSALVFFFRGLIMKLKFRISGGKAAKKNETKIPIVIFSDHKRYWNVFKPVCDEMERRGEACEFWTASPDDPALDEPYKHITARFIGEGNKAYAKLNMLNAGICLATTPGLGVYQWKRSKDTDWYVHIYHSLNDGGGYRMFGLDHYDAVLLSAAYMERDIRVLEEKRGYPPKETVVVGCTYMDTLLAKKNSLPPCDQRSDEDRTILLAPSWGDGSILNRFGRSILEALQQTGYRIIVRPHPQTRISDPGLVEGLMQDFPESDRFHWDEENDNFHALSQSDLMISDYSSVIFDFTLIFDRPILYAESAFDPAPYDASWLDGPTWRETTLPLLGEPVRSEDLSDLKSLIDRVLTSETYSANRAKVKEELWECIGTAAQKTADYLLKKRDELVSD